jgi:hypothetical protein
MAKDNVRIVQLFHPKQQRRIAIVKEPSLIFLQDIRSVYDLALNAINTGKKIDEYALSLVTDEKLDYDPVYNGKTEWKLLPSFDHPGGPFGCLVSGTGLTHKNSALSRQSMHVSANDKLTDSMIMYQWGEEEGSPGKGKIGVQPEWFYKGNGSCLRAHGQTLEVPAFGNDGGEEPEVAGAYVVDEEGKPWRIGFTTGNEFSDHVMEKKNYLYLAPSKLRQCSIGPELVLSNDFGEFEGNVRIIRNNDTIWTKGIRSGEKNITHSIENMEYHHFKYPGHQLPLQAHIHYFGADAFSFGMGMKLQEGDTMRVEWKGMGRALENKLKISGEKESLIKVKEF